MKGGHDNKNRALKLIQIIKEFLCLFPHLIFLIPVYFVVVSDEMQEAVDEESFEFLMEGKPVFFSLFFGFREADDDVAENDVRS